MRIGVSTQPETFNWVETLLFSVLCRMDIYIWINIF